MKKSIVGQLWRSFFSHDPKTAALVTFDESINISYHIKGDTDGYLVLLFGWHLPRPIA